MALSQVTYTATGSTDTWAFSFSYLSTEHVKLYLDGVEDVGATFPTASSIQASGGNPTAGVVVLVKRETPSSALVTTIGNSGSIRNSDINNQSLQALYVAEEAVDLLGATLSLDATNVYWDALTKQLKNLADPTAAQDAATKAYVDANTGGGASDSAAAAQAALDEFQDIYLGAAAADPTLDLDGDPLAAGMLYFNTSSEVLKYYTGSVWEAFTSAVTAAAIANTPAGNIAATDVQAALNELDTEKQAALGYTPLKAGKHTVFIPVGAMVSSTTSGAELVTIETTTNKQNVKVMAFDTAADEHAEFGIWMPKSWNESTVTFQVVWLANGTGTTGVAWGLQAVGYGDSDILDVAWGTAVVVTDDQQNTDQEILTTAESSAVTIAGTPAEGDYVHFRIFRDVSDANDDLAVDAYLLGVKVFITLNAEDDA